MCLFIVCFLMTVRCFSSIFSHPHSNTNLLTVFQSWYIKNPLIYDRSPNISEWKPPVQPSHAGFPAVSAAVGFVFPAPAGKQNGVSLWSLLLPWQLGLKVWNCRHEIFECFRVNTVHCHLCHIPMSKANHKASSKSKTWRHRLCLSLDWVSGSATP